MEQFLDYGLVKTENKMRNQRWSLPSLCIMHSSLPMNSTFSNPFTIFNSISFLKKIYLEVTANHFYILFSIKWTCFIKYSFYIKQNDKDKLSTILFSNMITGWYFFEVKHPSNREMPRYWKSLVYIYLFGGENCFFHKTCREGSLPLIQKGDLMTQYKQNMKQINKTLPCLYFVRYIRDDHKHVDG